MAEYEPSCPNFNGNINEMKDFNKENLDCADTLLPNTPYCDQACVTGNMLKAQQCLNNAMLDKLAEGTDAKPQVQSDWTETNNTKPSYIWHKPDLYSKSELDAMIKNVDTYTKQQIDDKDKAVKDYVDSKFKNALFEAPFFVTGIGGGNDYYFYAKNKTARIGGEPIEFGNRPLNNQNMLKMIFDLKDHVYYSHIQSGNNKTDIIFRQTASNQPNTEDIILKIRDKEFNMYDLLTKLQNL